MRNLIVCCDGTWNSANHEDDNVPAPTNVRKLFEAIDLDTSSPSQLSRYQSGVGTGGLVDKVLGGIVGYGLSEDIRDCYQWLSDKFQPGDNIYLFGFSRGAFTARSLAGLIGKYGLVNFDSGNIDSRDSVVKHIYRDGYRNGKSLEKLKIDFHPGSNKIKFIGAWDTVGALGIPNDKSLLNIFDNPQKYQFHDVKLGDHVTNARHALALNEKRGSFTPTLWQPDRNDGSVKQIWFPGVHRDVGGGYKEHGLSDGSLKWMLTEACAVDSAQNGLKFNPIMLDQIEPNSKGLEHDSYTGLMKALVSAPRSIPNLDEPLAPLHQSVLDRRRNPPLNQGNYLLKRSFVNGETCLDIYAKHPWYWTGIYLEKGKKYSFSATGEWMDASITSSPQGMDDGKFHKGEIVQLAGTVIGWFEKGWKKLFKNEQADFFGTKRVEHADWFCLMGAIANGGNPSRDGTHETLEQFEIGSQTVIEVKQPGYLYCFANDAWGFYHNNRGYVTLRVKEVVS